MRKFYLQTMIKAVAIDDEPVALDIIRFQAAKVPFVELSQTFTSARAALDHLSKEDAVDLIFLDINMPDMGGLEFAALVDPRMQIIFTTAHPQHAVTGYELAITDFLLKPINFERFLKACQRAQQNLSGRITEIPVNPRKSLFVKDGYNWVRIFVADILYVKGEDNYLQIVEQTRKTLIRMTMQELLDKAADDTLIRVHKSYLVNICRIQKLEANQLFIEGFEIPVSKSFAGSIKEKLSRT